MKVHLEQTGIGGREVELHVEAESALESIALRAWYAQHVINPNAVPVMPTRYIMLRMPFEFPAQFHSQEK